MNQERNGWLQSLEVSESAVSPCHSFHNTEFFMHNFNQWCQAIDCTRDPVERIASFPVKSSSITSITNIGASTDGAVMIFFVQIRSILYSNELMHRKIRVFHFENKHPHLKYTRIKKILDSVWFWSLNIVKWCHLFAYVDFEYQFHRWEIPR